MRLDNLGELGIFRQEAVAGVNRIGAGNFSRRQDARLFEIAFRRWRGTDTDAFVGKAHGHGVTVGFRMDDDRLQSHFLARAVDAQRNLAAVGDQDFADVAWFGHDYSIRTSGSPYSTGWEFCT